MEPLTMNMNRIQRSLDAEIKSGAAADGCRFRFKAVADSEVHEHRHGFALVVAAWATVELGGKRVPPVRWFKAAGSERADWGSDSWAGDGFVDAPSGEIWLSEDLPNRNLADVVAHETLHALKHCSRTASVETEIEAGEFGDRVAEQWALSDNPYAALFVVETKADLPRAAYPSSSAFVQDEMAVYRASGRGTPSNPIWVEHRHFTKDGMMRRVPRYRGETFIGMTAVKA